VRVSADPPLEAQVDGERSGTTPFEAVVVPGGAWVMVPRAYAEARGLRDVGDA
jgi:diacylglycerol kinase family enzyme